MNKTDSSINLNTPKKPIIEAAKKIDLQANDLDFYTNEIAKIKVFSENKKGKLVLVTAITPTPAGEGKTTTAIGLNDGLRKLGLKSVLALREPSMGPVFGKKGGATGGGYAQVMPMDKINLHFTGDIHAISAANNLIAATIDNHIFWGNQLKIKQILWTRALDVNDRSLRNLKIKIKGDFVYDSGFKITAASEIMAIFCLAKDLDDLAKRLDQIVIGYNEKDLPIFLKDLKITGALLAILKEAFKPNLVQTLEYNPAIIHGGPFANIAHGCNSIVATNLALSKADIVITEAGFGADLGAEKFLNIKTRMHNLNVNCIVIVATIKALKMQGGQKLADLANENLEALQNGIKNLIHHLKIIKSFKINFVIAINQVKTDSKKELAYLQNWANENNYPISLNKSWAQGGKGALSLAQNVISHAQTKQKVNYTYDLNDSLKIKIKKLATNIYQANDVSYSTKALADIAWLEKNNFSNLYICIAKTPNTVTDQITKLGYEHKWTLEVNELILNNGAGFIVVKCGPILTMPGLSSKPNSQKIKVINHQIENLD